MPGASGRWRAWNGHWTLVPCAVARDIEGGSLPGTNDPEDHCSDTVECWSGCSQQYRHLGLAGVSGPSQLPRETSLGGGRSFRTSNTQAFPSAGCWRGLGCHLWYEEGFPESASAWEGPPPVACSPSVPSENAPPVGPSESDPDCTQWPQRVPRLAGPKHGLCPSGRQTDGSWEPAGFFSIGFLAGGLSPY